MVLIAGPTASGKSAVATALAGRIGGVVVNADSMQVYRELRILTARPDEAECARVPHLLYGHVPAAEAYSAGRFTAEAAVAIEHARTQGRVAVVAGGTGLYLRSLIEPMSPVPPVPGAVREKVRARMAAFGPAAAHETLADIDPAAASRLPAGDSQRIARALEVYEATGVSLSEWHRAPKQPPVLAAERVARLILWPDREALRERIADRFHAMIEAGALGEAAAYGKLRLSDELPATRAHGLRALMRVAEGTMGLDEAIAGAIDETRQYAKRQFTWFRHQFAYWPRADPAAADIAAMLESKLSG
ncbi:MAG: tRNA (adenosine(37)-N6)-dimethylallyltransferase MiaA [Flavobacteriaceae bacterium]